MDTNLNKLKNIFFQSNLLENEQKSLLNFFSKAKDDDLFDLVILFEKNPEYIEIINNIYKVKREAFKNKDSAKLEEIINQEYESLKFLESN